MTTYHGSCHCGAVRFEADLDLQLGTIKCNCSICLKGRFWPAIVKSESFRLLAGDTLKKYQFNSMRDQHWFCSACGIRPFVVGHSPRWGDFHAVNVTCLDDVSEAELVAAPVTYLDGRHDNWDHPPPETRHL